MMLLHFLQRILNTLPRTFSSAIEYLAEQASQTIFIMAPERRASSRAQTLANNGRERPVEYRVQARTGATRRLGTLTSNICWRFFSGAERVAQKDRFGALGADRHQPHRHT